MRSGGVSTTKKAEIYGPVFGRLQHLSDIPCSATVDAHGDGTQRSADHGGDAGRKGVFTQLCGVEVHMHIDAAGRGDQTLGIADRGRSAAYESPVDSVHYRRVAGLPDAGHEAVLDADVALDHPENRVHDHNIADQHVQCTRGTVIAGGQTHSVAQASCLLREDTRLPEPRGRALSSARSDVSPRRTASPEVGPYMVA